MSSECTGNVYLGCYGSTINQYARYGRQLRLPDMCSGFFQTSSEHVGLERLHTNTSHKDAWFHAGDQILHCMVSATVPQSSLPGMNGAVAFILATDIARKLLKARMKDRNIRMPAIH